MPHLPKPIISFTARYNGISNKLTTETLLSSPFEMNSTTNLLEMAACAKKYIGLWDTGATNSVISQKIVDECGLKPIGMALVHSATESKHCEVYLISMFLPNKLVLPQVRVTKGVLTACDLLIGMDIINQGDFAVTHHNGKTTFSFRYPSMEEIDFVTQKPEPLHSYKVGRNDPCPCGSGKKYKKCCGLTA